jgi:hypothetical protein
MTSAAAEPGPTFEELAKEFTDPTLKAVDVDGVVSSPLSFSPQQDFFFCSARSHTFPQQAILKLVKHCTECLPGIATGQLVGLDDGPVLEVSNSFPLPQEDDDAVGSDFALDMLRCFREGLCISIPPSPPPTRAHARTLS